MSDLDTHRDELNRKILGLGDQGALDKIASDWTNSRLLITNWWKAYRAWEALDTFNAAVIDHRMTMRSFGSNFDTQVNKEISRITVAAPSRFWANSELGKLSRQDQERHYDTFAQGPAYSAKRGLDGSVFANPANFQTRALKYQHGLHDLSVKLVVPGQDIKGQSHHSAQPTPHFSFLPLSKGEDQQVIYKLVQYAKVLKNQLSDFYDLIHKYRTKMTRVKLANDYDMGTGYHAVPVANPNGGPAYKLTYGLGNQIKVRGSGQIPTTVQILRERQQAYFTLRANIARTGNEIVIAMRRHKGPFPVYAVYDTTDLKCFNIVGGQRVLDGRTISLTGHANW